MKVETTPAVGIENTSESVRFGVTGIDIPRFIVVQAYKPNVFGRFAAFFVAAAAFISSRSRVFSAFWIRFTARCGLYRLKGD